MPLYNNIEAAEDTVQCFFFSTASNVDWVEMCENINKKIISISKDYIWHKDKFQIHVPVDSLQESDMPPHLRAITNYSDNIEDEWFILYIIIEISKYFPELVIQINDSDGEFILIEAAEYLPSWANPDTTVNRLFINNNQIHLIPPNIVGIGSELNIRDAIKYVADPDVNTSESDIYKAVMKRIGDYPQKIEQLIHKAVVKLPIDIATILKLAPDLLSPIVTTYCNHDVVDLKAFRNVKYDDCVLTEVKFTKCLYAMLMHSKLIKNNKYTILNQNDKKSALGIKVTCGYEIIMRKVSEDIFSSKAYEKFHKSLMENGYFKGNIEGSKDYNQYLEKAKEFFLCIDCPISSQACNVITNLINSDKFREVKNDLRNTIIREDDLVDDSDDWLKIHPEQLNELLDTHYGKQPQFEKNDTINATTITTKLSNFIKQTSDFEGIEVGQQEQIDSDTIDFDPDEFAKSLEKMLNLLASDGAHVDKDLSDDDNSEDDENSSQDENDDLYQELQSKLLCNDLGNSKNSKPIMLNLTQSIKEEGATSGPTSNILRQVGINKPDLLDSDDDSDS